MHVQVQDDDLSQGGVELLQGHIACDGDVVKNTEALAAVEEGVVGAARQVPRELSLLAACG